MKLFEISVIFLDKYSSIGKWLVMNGLKKGIYHVGIFMLKYM